MCENRLRRVSFSVQLFLLIFLNRGLTYPTEDVQSEGFKSLGYPLKNLNLVFEDEEPNLSGQKGCFHFYVSRNISTLLSDATKMLQQSHNRREQEWILTFIYRIKALAEHLRTHPESQNYDCISSENEASKKGFASEDRLKPPQQELYFVDDFLPSHVQKRSHVSGSGTNSNDDLHLNVQQPSNLQLSSPHLQEALNGSNHITPKISDQEAKTSSSERSNPDNTNQEMKNPVYPLSFNEHQHSIISHDSNDEKTNNLADPVANPPDSWRQESMSSLSEEESGGSSGVLLKKSSDPNEEEAQGAISESGSSPVVKHSELNYHEDEKSEENNESSLKGMNNEPPPLPKEFYDRGLVLSSPPDCGSSRACEEALRRHVLTGSHVEDDSNEYLITQHFSSPQLDELWKERMLRDRIKNALLEDLAPKIKKLKIVGGTEQDLLDLWKIADIDLDKLKDINYLDYFDYEENGATTDEMNFNDKNAARHQTEAPFLGEKKNIKIPASKESGSTKPYEPYDDSDVLVKQLFDIRYEKNPKTTISLSDQDDEYLITSTPIPY